MIRKKYRYYIFLLVYAFIMLFFCTKSSPLYRLNEWFDVNAYFTMGKGMMNGAVPYKDLFDHKGPLLYLIYGVAYLISSKSFFGVFLFQVVSMSMTMIFSYKISLLFDFSERKSVFLAMLTPVLSLSGNIIYFAAAREYGGGSPDEFIMPIYAASLYIIIKGFKDNTIYSNFEKEMFYIGILSCMVVLLKFTYIIFFVGLLLPVFISMLKTPKYLFRLILSALLGCIVAFVPYLIYTMITGSLFDFVEVYFKFNAVYGLQQELSTIERIIVVIRIVGIFFLRNFIYFINILISIVYCFHKILKERKNAILYLSIFLSFFLTVSVLSVKFAYYSMISVAIFNLFGYMIVLHMLERKFSINNRRVINSVFITLIIGFTVMCNMLVFSELNRFNPSLEKLCQQEVADIISSDSPNNQMLLEVGSLDSGFYTALGIVPESKYFYVPNVRFEQDNRVFLAQYESVKNCLNPYVVTRYEAKYDKEIENSDIDKNNIMKKIGNEITKNYYLVTKIEGTCLQKNRIYYLYKLNNR